MIRRVKLHRDGDGQFIDIRRDFEFPGEDVIIRKEGDKLVIEPAPQKNRRRRSSPTSGICRPSPQRSDALPALRRPYGRVLSLERYVMLRSSKVVTVELNDAASTH